MKNILLLFIAINLHATTIAHTIALKTVEFASPEESIPFTGFFRMKKQSDFFFKDLGAKFIEEKDFGFKGIYLSFDMVRNNSGKTFGKWREILKNPKNTKLLSLFEANLASSNLSELFSFPRDVHFLKNAKNKTVIIFLDYTVPLTMQIREILNFSLRGYNVLAIDFYHYNEGKHFIPWEKCKKVADTAFKYVNGNVIVYGKSFGSAPATYLASKHSKIPLIIDRPFTCMKEVIGSFFLDNFINLHYSYPTEKLIHGITTQPLIISSSENTTFKDHAKKILNTYISFQKNEPADKIVEKCFISTKGGHYSSLLNKGVSSWFSYEEAQRKLNKYLNFL